MLLVEHRLQDCELASMTRYSFAQLEGLWIQAGGDKLTAPMSAGIAMAESGVDSTAHSPTNHWGMCQRRRLALRHTIRIHARGEFSSHLSRLQRAYQSQSPQFRTPLIQVPRSFRARMAYRFRASLSADKGSAFCLRRRRAAQSALGWLSLGSLLSLSGLFC